MKRNQDIWAEESAQIHICPLCSREMVIGPTTDDHHLIPKSRKGKETVKLHLICHRKIHSILTEKEIATKYYTIELLQTHPEIHKFIEWVSGKDPEFVITHRESKDKKGKRRK
jgi:hypothetical protein